MTEALSSWWAESSHRAVRNAGSVEKRLALALGPVRSIIRVVDSHVPAMTVNWARWTEFENGTRRSLSATDFTNGRIYINPLPIISGMDTSEAIDIEAGFGLHEASHAEESRDRFGDLLDKHTSRVNTRQVVIETPAFRPFRVAVWLWNLVEDVRIEDVTGRKWPGSRPYFAKVLAWMWSQHPVAIKDFEAHDIEHRMKIVFVACRFADKLHLISRGHPDDPARAENILDDPERRAEVEWWQAWQADYLTGRTDVRETIRRGLEHLALDPETAQEMSQMEAEETAAYERGERVRAMLDRMLKEGIGDLPVCVTEDGEIVPLTPEMAAAVDKLVREELRSEKPLFTGRGAQCAEVRVTRPEETAASRRAYIGRPSPLVEALRTALVFRQSAPEWDVKLQKSGDIDDEELWRLSTGDVRVFSEHVIESRPDAALGLLVDMSGSMAGDHLAIAQRLAQTFLWALHDGEGVNLDVWGHTADVDEHGADVFRLWEPGDPMSRLGLISTMPHSNNADGFAIAWCVSQMKERPEPQKTLIVLSDGYPNARDYGDDAAEKHVRTVVEWADRQGVNVIQIAIDHEIRAEEQAAMFGPGRWLPFVNDRRLLLDLTRIMARAA